MCEPGWDLIIGVALRDPKQGKGNSRQRHWKQSLPQRKSAAAAPEGLPIFTTHYKKIAPSRQSPAGNAVVQRGVFFLVNLPGHWLGPVAKPVILLPRTS